MIPLLVARLIAGTAVAGLLWFCTWRAPRGFALFSRPFFEQEVLLPAFALLATAPFVSMLTRVGPPPWVYRLAFWSAVAPLALALAVVGRTEYAHVVVAAAALGFTAFFVSERRFAHRRLQRTLVSVTLGLLVGMSFLAVMRAPPATTHPRSADTAPPAWTQSLDGSRRDLKLTSPFGSVAFEASPTGPRALVVDADGERLTIEPGFELTSYSPSCLWSVVDYQHEELPPFHATKLDARTLGMGSEGQLASTFVRVTAEDDGVHVESTTLLHREVCVHLAHALSFSWSEPTDLTSSGPRRFLAFRDGALELLRATEAEKGPFTTLRRLPNRDPVLRSAGLAVEIGGFVAQAAREPSPTAGYGVSQAAIEASGGTVWVELAATSIGRGWDTVRLAPGSYSIDLHVRRRK